MNFKVSQLKSLTAGEVAVDDLIYVIDSNPTDGSVKSKKVTVGDLIDSRIYGISSSQFVLITGYYADPSWISSLDWSKITNAPSFVTSLSALTDVQLSTPLSGQALVYNGTKWVNQGIGELDTLDSVTTRGNTTTNPITVGGLVVDTNTLVVDSVNNRVGIGTSSPDNKISVLSIAGEQTIINIGKSSVVNQGVSSISFGVNNGTYNSTGLFKYEVGLGFEGFVFSTGSTANLLTIRNDRVGIGTLSPGGRTEIRTTNDNGLLLTASSVDSTFGPVLAFQTTTGSTSIGSGSADVIVKGHRSGLLRFSNRIIGNTLDIASTGNVLIGTTTDAGYKLDVNGTFRAIGPSTGVYLGNNVDVQNILTANALYIRSGSNISAGLYPYSVGTGGIQLQSEPSQPIIRGAFNEDTTIFPARNDVNNLGDVVIQGGGSERVRFKANGNVLINTTTDAGYKLDVNGTGRFSSYLYVGGGSGSGLATSSTNTSLVIWNRTVTASGDGILLGNGFNSLGGSNINLNLVRVPVGTTYGGGTNTTNVIYITPTINNSGGTNILRGIYYEPTLTSLTGTTHRAIETTSGDVIFNGGNVGIGTSSPTCRLQVIGGTGFKNSSIVGIDITQTNSIHTNDRPPIGLSIFGTYTDTNTGNNTIYEPFFNVTSSIAGDVSLNWQPRNLINLSPSITLAAGRDINTFTRIVNIASSFTARIINNITGIYYNPTLTGSVNNHRAIETVTGNVLFNTTSGNTLIGTSTDAGYKLDVLGTTRTLASVENVFRVEHTNGNYATILMGNGSALASGQFGMYFNGAGIWSTSGNSFRVHSSNISVNSSATTLQVIGGYGGGSGVGTSVRLMSNTFNQGVFTATSGSQVTVIVGNGQNERWEPSSGNASYTLFAIAPVINTSGTYSGIVTGFAYNPTLTSITGVTHRAIHTVTGDILLGTTSGNVGIGTTTPTNKLDIAYVSGRFISFTQRPGYADYGRIQFTNVTGGDIYSSARIDLLPNDTDQSVGLGNGLTSRRLASSTNYGAYGPTPAGFLVTTNAAFAVLSANVDVNTDSFVFSGPTGARHFFKVVQNNVPYFTIMPTGNVLINTTTDAGYKLDVAGTIRSTGDLTAAGITSLGSNNSIWAYDRDVSSRPNDSFRITRLYGYTSFGDRTYVGGFEDFEFLNFTHSTSGSSTLYLKSISDIQLHTNNTSVLNITSSGRVGIGTTSPSYKTQISQAGGSSTAISTIASTNYNLIVQNTTDLAGTYSGIGFMNPFDTQGYIGVAQVGTGYGAGGNMLFALRPAGGGTVMTEYMRLTSGGNLLLGTTTNSGYKLDVNGGVRVQGELSLTDGNILRQSGAGSGLRFISNNIQLFNQGVNAVGSFILDASGTNIRVGFGTTSPDNSSILDLTSTTRGFLKPRLTTTEKNAITTPATGLEVYDSTTNTPNYFNGTTWVGVASNQSTGLSPGLFSQTSDSVAVTNTTVESSLISTGVGTLSVPANGFQVGAAYIAYLSGVMSSQNNATMEIHLRSNGFVLADTNPMILSATTGKFWELHVNFVIRAIGGGGVAAIVTSGRFSYNKDSGNTPESLGFSGVNNTTFDTTINNTLAVTATWGNASPSNSIQTRIFNLYRVY